MPGVTASELARLRSDFRTDWFTESVTLTRPSKALDGKGGYTNVPTVVWSGNVRRKPSSETARNESGTADIGDRASEVSYWSFSFPAETDVRTGDTITVGDRSYRVAGPGLDKTLEIARYVLAVEMP